MLLGTFDRTVDPQWRITLPSDLLDQQAIDSGIFCFTFLNDCLVMFDEASYQNFSANIQRGSAIEDPKMRRWFFGSTYKKKRDKGGRVQIPEKLRERSGLRNDEPVEILGAGAYAELRHPDHVPEEPSAEARARYMQTLRELERNE